MQIKVMTPKQKEALYTGVAIDLAVSLKREGVVRDNCLIGLEGGKGKPAKLNFYDNISDHAKITEEIMSDGAIDDLHLAHPNEYLFILTLKENPQGYFGLFCAEDISDEQEKKILDVAYKVFPRHGMPLSQLHRP